MKAFWDERYAATDYAYGEQPNVWFAEQLARLAPGRLLLPCEGEGRNAVHAARLGWEVEAFDQSEAGRNKAMELAARYGQSISYALADALTYENTQPFDAAALVFAHLPEPLRAAFHRRMANLLKPGGMLLFEGFHTTQLGRSSGGPRELSMLFTPDMLRTDFPDFHIQQLEVATVHLNEGPFHQGEAVVVRLLAQKKGA